MRCFLSLRLGNPTSYIDVFLTTLVYADLSMISALVAIIVLTIVRADFL